MLCLSVWSTLLERWILENTVNRYDVGLYSKVRCTYESGASIPLRPCMMHFPLFQIFPLFSKKIRTLRKIFTILSFPEKCLDFHTPKFLMTFIFFFLVIDHHKFRIFPP